MNKNKKIISASLALALGVSLIIPNAKANEEKSVEKALKEPVKTSEKVKTEEKSAVENEKITINKAPVNEGETGADKEEKGTDKEETGADKEETGTDKKETEAGKEEKPDDKTEKPETNEETPKDEKKVKPKEYKMSELLNEKGAFEKSKEAQLAILGFEIMQSSKDSFIGEETVDAMRRQYEKLQKATTWEEMGKILGYSKEYFARTLLEMKGVKDARNPELVKIIDDMANQKPQNPSQNNPNRKNKKTGTTNTVNTANTANTGNKVNNAGENVQTGVGSLSAILGLLGASSLGLFKSKRK